MSETKWCHLKSSTFCFISPMMPMSAAVLEPSTLGCCDECSTIELMLIASLDETWPLVVQNNNNNNNNKWMIAQTN
jgi:hypothetical protein